MSSGAKAALAGSAAASCWMLRLASKTTTWGSACSSTVVQARDDDVARPHQGLAGIRSQFDGTFARTDAQLDARHTLEAQRVATGGTAYACSHPRRTCSLFLTMADASKRKSR